MDCLVVALTARQRDTWITALEDFGEEWRCAAVTDAAEAYAAMTRAPWDVCVLCDCPEARALARRLAERPPIAPPWVVAERSGMKADLTLSLAEAGSLPPLLHARAEQGWMPVGAMARLPQITCLARGMLDVLSVRQTLRAWAFLPDMAALTVVHPPLIRDLTSRLYPLVARRHGLTVSCVERSLRILVESTWSHGSLSAMERFFGHSVDPERGKPTNREFLYRVQERLSLAAERIR